MARYTYEAMNGSGQKVASELEAGNVEEALARIRRGGCYPTRIAESRRKQAPAKTRNWRGFSIGGIPRRVVAEFTEELSMLQDAGLPLVRSLAILGQQQKHPAMRQVLAQVKETVEEGSTLSEAMARQPKAFDRLYVKMVKAGETGGVLDVILQRLSEFMDKAQRLKRRVIGAMIYPAAVIAFSVLIVTGIMIVVVPKFREVFRDFRVTLPWLTVALMNTAEWVAHQYGWLAILGSPVAVLILLKLVGRTAGGRWLIDRINLRLPVVGKIVGKTAVARFSRTLGTLLAAGVPILEALEITRETVGNGVYARALLRVQEGVREGETFAGPLRASGVCDPLVANMIDVGEETGDLDKMLMKIADKYEEQVDVLVASLMSLLEPAMVMVLGGMVGTIVLALFWPLAILLQQNFGGA